MKFKSAVYKSLKYHNDFKAIGKSFDQMSTEPAKKRVKRRILGRLFGRFMG